MGAQEGGAQEGRVTHFQKTGVDEGDHVTHFQKRGVDEGDQVTY